jgi:hypothetical protein
MGGGHWHPVWEDPRTGARSVGPRRDTFGAAYLASRQSARAGPDGPEVPGPGAVMACRGALCRGSAPAPSEADEQLRDLEGA